MESPTQGKPTLFKVSNRPHRIADSHIMVLSLPFDAVSWGRKALGLAIHLSHASRYHQGWRDSAPVPGSDLQESPRPTSSNTWSQAFALQWGNLAWQQADAAGGSKETGPAKWSPPRGKVLVSTEERMGDKFLESFVFIFSLGPSRRSCLLPWRGVSILKVG